jgi:hypothetical protein
MSDFVNKSALFVSPTSFPTQISFATTASQTKCLLINSIVSLHQPQCWNAHILHNTTIIAKYVNFRMNTGSGRYGAAYNMVVLLCFNEELSLLPKNPTEAKLQATSTRGESTEPT